MHGLVETGVLERRWKRKILDEELLVSRSLDVPTEPGESELMEQLLFAVQKKCCCSIPIDLSSLSPSTSRWSEKH